jgi:putative iron-regulated protein
MTIKKSLTALFVLTSVFSIGACSDDEDGSSDGGSASGDLASEVVAQYSKIVAANYADSIETAQALADAAETLKESPTEANLEAARDAWKASREPYQETEVFRFYDGPIDNEATGPEGLLNAWPLDEQAIDYVNVQGTVEATGIVNGTEDITLANILAKNDQDGTEADVTVGYHAVEFLLWGQDRPGNDTAGQRPATDYDDEANAERRADYLVVATQAIVSDLQGVADEWKTDGAYRTEFEAADTDESLLKIITGMYGLAFTETGGERLEDALASGNQEQEHSCFSDNTNRDMIQNAVGIQNVWKGSYKTEAGETLSGKGIKDIVEEYDADLAKKLDGLIQDSVDAANDLDFPFDNASAFGPDGADAEEGEDTEGREKIIALVNALQAVGTELAKVITGLELGDVPE